MSFFPPRCTCPELGGPKDYGLEPCEMHGTAGKPFLSVTFGNNEDQRAFDEWWETEGERLFVAWKRSRK